MCNASMYGGLQFSEVATFFSFTCTNVVSEDNLNICKARIL